MQRIVPLLPIALVLLAFAAAPSRPVNAQGSGQDPRFDDCVESVVYSILQAQHIEGGTIEADDVRGRNVEAAKTICLSMEQAGIMGDQPSDAIDTCTGLLLPDGATNDDARQVMIGCARAVIGRSAAPPDDPPLDMNVLAGCVQLARDQGFAPEAADYLDALAFCYLARLSAPPTACRAVERPGDLALSAVKLKSLAQAMAICAGTKAIFSTLVP